MYVVIDGDGKRVYELTRQNNFEPNQLTHDKKCQKLHGTLRKILRSSSGTLLYDTYEIVKWPETGTSVPPPGMK
jgi:hypothetical protein